VIDEGGIYHGNMDNGSKHDLHMEKLLNTEGPILFSIFDGHCVDKLEEEVPPPPLTKGDREVSYPNFVRGPSVWWDATFA